MRLVLDASVALAWIFTDEHNAVADLVADRVLVEGAAVPSLWKLEIANALRSAVRRGRCDDLFVDQTLADLGKVEIAVDNETDARAWSDTLRLSREEGLTMYDAAYLELALRSQAPLASADRKLIDAARRRGLDVLAA